MITILAILHAHGISTTIVENQNGKFVLAKNDDGTYTKFREFEPVRNIYSFLGY